MAARTIYHPDQDTLSEKSVERFFTALLDLPPRRSTVGDESTITAALAGGTSLLGFYRTVVKMSESLDPSVWRMIRFCLADERLVPPGNSDSNFRMLQEEFFAPLSSKGCITREQVIPVDTASTRPEEDYTTLVPSVDIALLGAGPDGHVASLFPDHPSIRAADPGFILVEDSPKPPPRRISMSPAMVRSCKMVFLFFISKNKRDAYRQFMDPGLTAEQLPCKLVLSSDQIFVITDLNT